MATHTIRYRDWRHDAPRTILWNDETGEVSGDHGDVPGIRAAVERAVREGHLPEVFGCCHLRDPRRDPADFLAVLHWVNQSGAPLELPAALRGVEPTAWTFNHHPGEVA